MNERIRELMAEAQKVVGYTDGGYTEIKALDQEKFAELIVRECACKIEEMIDNGWYADTEQLKKHFGVEE